MNEHDIQASEVTMTKNEIHERVPGAFLEIQVERCSR